MFNLYCNFLSRYRYAIWAAILLLVTFLALGLQHFRVDASADELLLEQDPDLKRFRQISREFPNQDFLFILFEPDGGVFTPQALQQLDALAQDVEKIPEVKTVFSVLDAPLLQGLSFTELAGDLPNLRQPGVDLDAAREELINSPVFSPLLVSDDGGLTGVLVTTSVASEGANALLARRYELWDQLEVQDSQPLRDELQSVESRIKQLSLAAEGRSRALVEKMRALIQQHQSDQLQLHLVGPSIILVDVIDFATSDLVIFGALTLGLFTLILFTLFRRPIWVLLPLGLSAIVVASMMGLFGWTGWLPSIISSNFVALLLILSISLSIHLIVNFQEQCNRHPQLDSVALVSQVMNTMFWPCLFTALTTMVGFGSLVISGIKPVINFGLMMFSGIGMAFIIAFTLLPLCLISVNRRTEREVVPGRLNEWLAGQSLRHPRWIIALASLVLLIGITGVGQLKVDNRFIDYFHSDTEIYQGMEKLDRHLGGTMPLDIVLDAPEQALEPAEEVDDFGDFGDFGDLDAGDEQASESGYWYNTRTVELLRRITQKLDEDASVGVVQSYFSALQVAEQLNDGKPLNDFEMFALRELVPEDFRQLLLGNYLSNDDNRMRISMRLVEGEKAHSRKEFLAELKTWLQQQPELENARVDLVGLAVLYNNMLQSLFDSQIRTLALVFVAIGLMIALLFRSLRIALLGMLPNLLAVGMVLGLMGWLGISLDLMTVTIAAISIGIAVDNCIHYCYRYRSERRAGADPQQALIRSHTSIGRALYFTSLSVMGGFLIMVTSNFIPTVYFGLFTVLAMLTALLGALTLLPVLLLRLKKL